MGIRVNSDLLRRFAPLLLLTGVVLAPQLVQATGFDHEAFERLDPVELRAAEKRAHEFLEPGTARLLRAPQNAAEDYVARRQQRLAAAMQRQPVQHILPDGSIATQAFWPTARATRARVDDQGRIVMSCVHASAILGHTPPDFRLGNQVQEVVR